MFKFVGSEIRMAIKVETYYHISEKQKRLAEIYAKDKNKTIFIVPSGLDKELILKLISGNGSFFGRRPTVWVWGELYRELANINETPPRRVIDPIDQMLILKYLLSLYLEEMEEEGVELPAGVKHAGFAKILGDNIRDLLLEEVLPDNMIEKIADIKNNPASPATILLRLYSDYICYLDRHELVDNAQIATLISRLLISEKVKKYTKEHRFVLIGFLTFTGSQLKLVKNSFDELVERIFILPNSGLGFSHDSIKQLTSSDGYVENSDLTINFMELNANNSYLQFNAIARELALWICSKSSLKELGSLESYGDIGIQVSETHLKMLENSLKRYKIPYNTQIRGNVAETLLGNLPKLIWNAYSSSWNTQDTIFLLSSPLIISSDFNTSKYFGLFPESYDDWEKVVREDKKTLNVLKRTKAFCINISKGGTPSEILREWKDYLSDLTVLDSAKALIKEEISLDFIMKDLSSSLIELDKKIKILEDSQRSIGEASAVNFTAGEAIQYILDWSRTATLPISLPLSDAVTVYAGFPPVLTEHKYWIMTDVDYDTWPGKIRESPLLSDEFKGKINSKSSSSSAAESINTVYSLHIPEVHEKRELKESLFRRLIATGKKGVIFTRSLTDSNARPKGKAQFIEPIRKNSKTKGLIEYPLSSILPRAGDSWFPEAEVSETVEKIERGLIPRSAGIVKSNENKSISLSSLDEWNKCPYRYWCKTELRIEKPRADLFDVRLAGSFIHKLWELSWLEYNESKQSFVNLTKNSWNEAIKEYPSLESDIRLKRHLDRLEKQVLTVAILLNEIETKIEGRTRVELETFLPEHEINGIVFRGRYDRADIFENTDKKNIVILDYKSNAASQHKNELQLAAYAFIKQKNGYHPAGYAWIGHRCGSLYGYFNDKKIKEAYTSSSRKNTMDNLIGEAEKAMEEMALSVKKGEYKANYDSESCRYCEFYTICRKREDLYYDLNDDLDNEDGGNRYERS